MSELDPMRHYKALVAKADELGWPIHYKTDLTVHDQRFCMENPAEQPFWWGIRDTGTDISVHEDYVVRFNNRVFYWNGSQLVVPVLTPRPVATPKKWW